MGSYLQQLKNWQHCMRKCLGAFVSCALSAFIACNSAANELDSARRVSDNALRDCVLAQLPKNGKALTRLKCHSKGVASLKGLEQFRELQELSLFNNGITDIEISHWPKLKNLNIAKNPISSLAINHDELKKLYVFSTMLSELSLRTPKLELLKANNSQLTSIHLLDVPNLSKCDIYNNQLKTMDISSLSACRHLDVRNNPMPDSLYEQMDVMPCLVLHDGNAEDWQ